MLRTMLRGNDGGVSLSKLIALVGFMTPLVMWVLVGLGMALWGWSWADWQGWFLGGGGLAAGGIGAHGVQRATWKPPSDY